MNTLYVSYTNIGGDWFGMVDSTPPQRLCFPPGGDIHEYAQAHQVAIQYEGEASFHYREALLFGDPPLPLDAGPNWPPWDALKDEVFLKWDDPYGGAYWEGDEADGIR